MSISNTAGVELAPGTRLVLPSGRSVAVVRTDEDGVVLRYTRGAGSRDAEDLTVTRHWLAKYGRAIGQAGQS